MNERRQENVFELTATILLKVLKLRALNISTDPLRRQLVMKKVKRNEKHTQNVFVKLDDRHKV